MKLREAQCSSIPVVIAQQTYGAAFDLEKRCTIGAASDPETGPVNKLSETGSLIEFAGTRTSKRPLVLAGALEDGCMPEKRTQTIRRLKQNTSAVLPVHSGELLKLHF